MEALHTQLKTGLAAMGIVLPDEASHKLIDYLGLLSHWNKAFNLSAIRDTEEMLSKHLLDSLSVLPFIGAGTVCDVGSGAGLPGIPLAIALPQNHFALIDSNGKKTRFLTQVKITLGLDNIDVINQRVEDFKPMRNDRRIYCNTVIARAYASADNILKSTAHLHQPGTRILVMQGKLDETLDVPGYILEQSHTLNVYGLNAQRHLLEIKKI